MLSNVLKMLGLKENEISLFLVIASLGISPASTIANKVNIKRTTCYQILEQLSLKGIIKKHIKSKIGFYEALSLEELELKLKTSINELSSGLDLIKNNRDELEKNYSRNFGDTKISFYEGFDGIKNAYNEILNAKDSEIYTMAKKDFNIKLHPLKTFWDKYYSRRLDLKKHSYNILSQDNLEKFQIEQNSKKLRTNLVLPSNIISTYGDIKVSGNKIIIVSQNEGRIFGVLLENEGLAKMFKDIFKFIWSTI